MDLNLTDREEALMVAALSTYAEFCTDAAAKDPQLRATWIETRGRANALRAKIELDD